jgi:hypothetical protein
VDFKAGFLALFVYRDEGKYRISLTLDDSRGGFPGSLGCLRCLTGLCFVVTSGCKQRQSRNQRNAKEQRQHFLHTVRFHLTFLLLK